MGLFTIATLALKFGPSIVRTVGGMLGGKAQEGAEAVAKVAEQVQGLPKALAEKKITEAIEKMDPETLVAMKGLQVEMARIDQERHHDDMEAEKVKDTNYTQVQTSEHKSEDKVVRQTRPLMAMFSYCVTALYVFYVTANGGSPDWMVIGTLSSPANVYIVGRSTEKVKGKAGPMMGLGALMR